MRGDPFLAEIERLCDDQATVSVRTTANETVTGVIVRYGLDHLVVEGTVSDVEMDRHWIVPFLAICHLAAI